MPTYQELYQSGELRHRAELVLAMLRSCRVCPRHCEKDRLGGKLGKCRVGRYALVASYGPHFGEEAPLVGRHGSGTIFFAHCNLRCIFCQNYTISHWGQGAATSAARLALVMLSLQERGCHNINLVSPTHVVPQILEALEIAAGKGLSLPIVYNTGGYDALDTLALLEGVVDIYMPDMKYSDAAVARQYSGIEDYPTVNRQAVKEMHRQVGDLELDGRGIAVRGLLVRHLVLPGGLAGTEETMRFLAQEVSPNTYVNIMAQYYPAYRAFKVPALARPLTAEEHRRAVAIARRHGLFRLDGVERGYLQRI